ncbi:MAG: pyridoxal phosphate-dependent aminotransferase [Thermodesulfobacteriota bacterium]|nr:pyridoxal phosphate-dependent aminotransferase [Thermodesulfobacteriota bacterium]
MRMLASQISEYLDKSSWIRKMFESGMELKAKHGQENVFDFSLGNPDLPPPASVAEGLLDLSREADKPFAFGYMPNPGYPFAREALAKFLSKEQGAGVGAQDVIITCGAAGGLNAIFRAVLEPGDEVVCPAPYFVEYGFYAANHNGVLKPVMSRPPGFELDIPALEAAIGPKTRVVLLNSPNNPAGVVYTEKELKDLARILSQKTKEYGRPVFLVSDEPYRFLVFDGCEVPQVLPLYPYSIVASSFSKNLSLAGERVGYLVLAPEMPGKETLLDGLTFTNRILGFVNAPAIGQRLMAKALGSQVDVSVYEARRNAMAEVLGHAGYAFTLPRGAFYFFPQAPGGDDVKFTASLREEKILAVPGTGFGCPGYFRLTFCVDEEVIRRSADGFARAIKKY